MKRIICIIMILLISFAYANDGEKILKIGLYYGSGALEEPQLQNFVGKGYELGYFDNKNDFVSLYSIDNIKLTMKVDKSYNIAVSDLYKNIDEAEDVIKTLKKSNSDVFVAYVDNRIQIRIGDYTTAEAAKSAIKSLTSKTKNLELKVMSPTNNSISVTDTDTKKILFEYTKSDYNLGILPISPKENAQTWFKGFKYYGGFEYLLKNNKISVINNVTLEDYIKGVTPYETNPSWPIEAQKAQALCAKSYALRSSNKHLSDEFDLCNTTHCQVYKGTSIATELSDKAVEDIIDEGIYYNGTLAETYYYSCNGGASENSENVWVASIPYLVGVKDKFENDSIPGWRYESEVTLTELWKLLNSKGYSIGTLESLATELTDMGNIAKIIFTDILGKELVFEKMQARNLLSKYVNSMRFNIYPKGGKTGIIAIGNKNKIDVTNITNYVINVDNKKSKLKSLIGLRALTSNGIKNLSVNNVGASDTYIIEGTGKGHNVGLSQWGAKIMAEEGYNYKEILKYYFTGVEIE